MIWRFIRWAIFWCAVTLPLLHLSAQLTGTDELDGLWKGELYQNEGGIADRFDLYFELRQHGGMLEGKAFVKLGDLMAEMQLTGTRQPDGSWSITETKILREHKDGMQVSWCMKQYRLRIHYRAGETILVGPWWGNSEYGPCIPGSIRLKRTESIA